MTDATTYPTFFSFDVETTATVVEAGELLTVGCVPVVHDVEAGWVKHHQHFYMRLAAAEAKRARRRERNLRNEWSQQYGGFW